jgi:hypothetical protein
VAAVVPEVYFPLFDKLFDDPYVGVVVDPETILLDPTVAPTKPVFDVLLAP